MRQGKTDLKGRLWGGYQNTCDLKMEGGNAWRWKGTDGGGWGRVHLITLKMYEIM